MSERRELVAREVFALDADWRREYWDQFRRDFARQAQAYYDTADRILAIVRTPRDEGQAWRAFLDALDEFEAAAASLWAEPEGPNAEDMERLSQSRERVIECARDLASIRPEAHAARTIAGGGRTGERGRRWTCSRRRAMAGETMERPVHNHDPEQGPGLACRESLIGDCIRAEYAQLTRELDAARAENQRLREALERVANGGCERFYGTDCWQMGMDPHAEDYADRVCDPCFARRALAKDTEVSNGA